MSQLSKAIAFAATAHAGQTDKIGDDYIRHPLRVMEAIRDFGEKAMVVAVLHDVVEDTDHSMLSTQMAVGLTPVQVLALDAVTRRRGEKYLDFIRRIKRLGRSADRDEAEAGEIAEEVKRLDIRDNSATWRRPDTWAVHPLPRYGKAIDILNGKLD